MKLKTNFDIYLEKHLKDPDFATRFKKAIKAWDAVIDLAAFKSREKHPANRVHRVKTTEGDL
jgi:hypothetical protein